jgi:hypothetical protein
MDEYRLVLLKRRAEDADRLEERLRRLERSATLLRYRTGWVAALALRIAGLTWRNCCPVCQSLGGEFHEDECWLGLELHGHRPHTPS